MSCREKNLCQHNCEHDNNLCQLPKIALAKSVSKWRQYFHDMSFYCVAFSELPLLTSKHVLGLGSWFLTYQSARTLIVKNYSFVIT